MSEILTSNLIPANRYINKINTKAIHWLYFGIATVFFGAFCTFAKLPIVLPVSILIVSIFIINLITDKTSISNFFLLIVGFSLLPIIQRFQLAYGLADKSNYISVSLEFVTVIYFIKESPVFFKSRNKLALFFTVFLITFIIQWRDVQSAIENKFYIGFIKNYLFFVIAYSVSYRNKSDELIKSILKIFVLCSLLNNSYGLYQYFVGLPAFETNTIYTKGWEGMVFWKGFNKIVGINGLGYGLFYNLSFFIIMYFALRKELNYKKLLLINAVLSAVLLLTFTERTAVIMFAITTFTFLTLRYSKRVNYKTFIWAGFFLILFLFIYNEIAPFIEEFGYSGGMKEQRIGDIADIYNAPTMQSRMTIHWARAAKDVKSAWLFGDAFKGEYGYHNEYFNLIISLGIFGFFTWCLILIFITKRLIIIFNEIHYSVFLKKMSMLLLSFLPALLAAAIPNNPFNYTSGLVFFIFSGLLFGYIDYQSKEIKK